MKKGFKGKKKIQKRRLRGNYKKRRKFVPQKREFHTKQEIFLSRMASILLVPPNKVKGLFSRRTITTIRINPLKGNAENIVQTLKKKDYDLNAIEWAPNTFFVRNKDKSEISHTQEYKDGLFYIQNLSSVLPTIVLDPKDGEDILDMCAAPGSKTTHICAITNNNANIIANDSDSIRIGSLRNVLHQFGAKAKVSLNDSRLLWEKYPDYFDKILLDAPCSGEGLIYLNGSKPLRRWTIKKIKVSTMIQKELISSAFRALKPGGTLVYSTCTLEPEENEGVVTDLLTRYENAKIEKIKIDGLRGMNRGITKWSGNRYHQEVAKTMRVLPSAKMMGFYIAKITKT